jgi:hypothetical protein
MQYVKETPTTTVPSKEMILCRIKKKKENKIKREKNVFFFMSGSGMFSFFPLAQSVY